MRSQSLGNFRGASSRPCLAVAPSVSIYVNLPPNILNTYKGLNPIRVAHNAGRTQGASPDGLAAHRKRMKLPKDLEKEEVESAVRAVLEKESIELCSDSNIYIPVLKLNPELRKQIFYAKFIDELIIGYRDIEKTLENELHGLQNVNNNSDRVSRLLLVTNDGSPRFYSQLEFLHKNQGGRVLICRLDIDSLLMGNILELKDKQVKAVLLNRKKSVANVLKSLL